MDAVYDLHNNVHVVKAKNYTITFNAEGIRLQCKKHLNTHPVETQNLHLHLEQFLLKKKLRSD